MTLHTAETRTLDLPDRQKPEESSATKHLDAVTAAPVAATQAMENVVTGTPVEPVSQPAASPSAAGKGENIVNDIAAAAPAVQETAKAAAAAAISQKDSEASTSTGAGPCLQRIKLKYNTHPLTSVYCTQLASCAVLLLLLALLLLQPVSGCSQQPCPEKVNFTTVVAGPSNPAGTPSPPKKTASKKKGGGKKGKKGNKK